MSQTNVFERSKNCPGIDSMKAEWSWDWPVVWIQVALRLHKNYSAHLFHSWWLLNSFLSTALNTNVPSILFIWMCITLHLFKSKLTTGVQHSAEWNWTDDSATVIPEFAIWFWFWQTACCEIAFTISNLFLFFTCTLSMINIQAQWVICDVLFMHTFWAAVCLQKFQSSFLQSHHHQWL